MDGDTRSSSLGAPLDNGLWNGPLGAAMKPFVGPANNQRIQPSLLLNFDNNIRDLSQNNITSTQVGGSFVGGKFGQAISFGPTQSQYLQTATTVNLGFGTGDFTIDFWVFKLNRVNTYEDIVCLNQYAASPTRPFILFRYTAAADTFYFGLPANNYNWNPVANFPLNQWVYVAITRRSGTVNLFINGRSVLSFFSNIDFTSDGFIVVGNGLHALSTEVANAYVDNLRAIKGTALDISPSMMDRQVGY